MDQTFRPSEAKAQTPSIEMELLFLLARQGRLAPIPVLFTSGIIVSFISDDFPTYIWAGWFALVTTTLTIRGVVLNQLPKMSQFDEVFRLRIAIALSLVNGSVHGLSLFFFPELDGMERVAQSLFLLGINSITVITTAGYLPISLAYILPTLFPISILWATLPMGDEMTTFEIAMATMHFMFFPVFIMVAWETYKRFSESVEVRKQQVILNQKLEEALNEAERANMAKTRFLAAASHDLRQPIHTLSLFGAALNMQPLDTKSLEIASQMDVAVQNLASQFDALLDISKLDAGIIPINKKNFSLKKTLNRLRAEFEHLANDRQLTFEIQNQEEIYIYTDPSLFERIVRNLISNAIKYTETGSININFYIVDNQCLLSIRDTGIGIAENEKDKIFEEYYQADNPKRNHSQGLGLGLAIVQRLCRLLEIKIELLTELGNGSEFRLTLPQSSNDGLEEERLKQSSISGIHVLVIDDERTIRLAMQGLLQGLGCQVSFGQSIADACDVVRNNSIDVALIDFRLLNNENGLQVVDAIHSISPGLPTIMISGDTAPELIIKARQADIKLIHKPVSLDELTKIISEACFNSTN